MWGRLRSWSLTWARPSRSLWTSSATSMQLRWEAGANRRCRVRKDAVKSVLFHSKMGSCLLFPETERWSWACPSMASKWPHWTNVWVEPRYILLHSARSLTCCLWPNGAKWNCPNCCCDQDVLHRHPLYLIVRMLCYDDGLGAGKNLLALKTTDAQQEECSIWVYQCSSSVRIPYTLNDAMCHHVKKTWGLFLISGTGSVHLQGPVGFLWMRPVLGQVLMVRKMEEIRGDWWNNCERQQEITAIVRICFNFPFFYLQFWLTEYQPWMGSDRTQWGSVSCRSPACLSTKDGSEGKKGDFPEAAGTTEAFTWYLT